MVQNPTNEDIILYFLYVYNMNTADYQDHNLYILTTAKEKLLIKEMI